VPRETSVLCAYGAMNADLQWSSVLSLPALARALDHVAVNAALAPLVAAGNTFLDRLQVPAARRRYTLHVSARYPLQVTELEIACPHVPLAAGDATAIAAAFHRSYRERYTVAEPDNDVELVMWRLTAAGLTPPVASAPAASGVAAQAMLGTTAFYDSVARTMTAAPMVDPDRLPPGHSLEGPALLVAVDTTVVLPAGAQATMSEHGHLVVRLQA